MVSLPADEAAHLTRVLRLTAGEAIRVFDGRGREWDGEVLSVARQGVTVRLGEAVTPAPESQIAITLAVAVLKGDKMDEVVRDAVMLGVTQIAPLVTEHTEVAPAAIARGGRVSRWQRIAASSAKQCGRAVVPAVIGTASLTDCLDAASTGLRLMLVEPGSDAAARALRDVAPAGSVTLFVGPEGGWSKTEVRTAATAGAIFITLGSQTLRADKAPLVAITAVRVLWGDL